MHEKTLLYGALGFTALAAIYGVVHASSGAGHANATSEIQIIPVAQVDQQTLSSTEVDRKSTRLNSSHSTLSRMPSSA